MDVLPVHFKIFLASIIFKLIQEFFNLLPGLIPMFGFNEWAKWWYSMHFHREIHVVVQSCIWGLNVGNEWGHLFVILDEHPNFFFLQVHLLPCFLSQLEWCPFVLHWPLLHDINSYLNSLKSFDMILTLLLQVVQVENFLMHGDKLLINIFHGISQHHDFSSMDALSSSKYTCTGVAFWNFSRRCSIYCLAPHKLFAIYLFSTIRYSLFEFEANLDATIEFGFLLVYVIIIVSLMNARDRILSRKCFLLFCSFFL